MRHVADQPSPTSGRRQFFSSRRGELVALKEGKSHQDDRGHMMREGDSLQA